ncbi:hypothetical protein [Desulfosporosinus sp. OT]|uniref:hypothetical protein n=1 Tax=Desulfosporosinus sp. OT TaxID=913865 RepID=UPI000223A368|nr:hypothetical protein [Desulfosporosinus sp. OT]EGW36449.1 hypothetical protein DOT_5613 [Desulfosporosinus sp. OT]
MPTARTKANRKYNEKAYDRIPVTVPKGDKEKIKAFAEKEGLSVNAFVNMAINKQMPQKPIIEAWNPARCPSCGEDLSESLGDGYYKHWYGKRVCDCGQKLNWEEEVT